MPSLQSFVSLFIAFLLLLPPVAIAQTPVAPPAPKVPNPQDALKLFVLEGAGVSNFIPDRIGKAVVVEVRDKNDLPVEGASVLFELPQTGPGGSFSDGARSRTVKTDLRGQASVSFELSQEIGRFQIAVTATSGDRSGKATISQSNSLTMVDEKKAEHHRWYTSKKFLIIAAVVASGAAVGIILATRGGSSKSSAASTPTITITPGSPTFGGPN